MSGKMRNDERRKAAEAAARECVRVLKEKFGVQRAFVFGSIRGDSSWDERSDIDIAVEGLPSGRYIEALAELYELLPKRMELDLVPLERAIPSLAALAKGEVKMPKDPIEALTMEVQNELANLERIVMSVLAELAKLSKTPTELEIGGMGKYVHDFYEGVERIFERIEKRTEMPIPTGESKHTLLLQQMEREFAGKRPAVVDHALALRLHRYLRFRHLFRHTYGYELVWDELRPLVEGLSEVFDGFKKSVEKFLVSLNRTKKGKPKSKRPKRSGSVVGE